VRWMRTWLPVRVERLWWLWWLRGLRRLLLVLGTLPRVLRRDCNASIDILSRPETYRHGRVLLHPAKPLLVIAVAQTGNAARRR